MYYMKTVTSSNKLTSQNKLNLYQTKKFQTGPAHNNVPFPQILILFLIYNFYKTWYITNGEKYQAQLGFEPKAEEIQFLHYFTESSNQMSISLTIYYQIPISSYILMDDSNTIVSAYTMYRHLQ